MRAIAGTVANWSPLLNPFTTELKEKTWQIAQIAIDIGSNETRTGDSRLVCNGRGAPSGARIGSSHFLFRVAIAARKFFTRAVRWYEVSFRKLESGADTTDCTVLWNREKVLGGSSRVCGNETDATRNRSRGKTDTPKGCCKLTIVPKLTVKPGTWMSVRFDPMRQAGVSVEATGPVDIYVVSENDYPDFSERHNLYTAKYPRQTQFKTGLFFGPDIRKKWYLVFENPSTQLIDVRYEVYN